MNIQLGFPLSASNPFSLFYLVRHSGISEAISYLEQSLEDVCEKPGTFRSIVVQGEKGSGKTHLLAAFSNEALECGLGKEAVAVFEFDESSINDEKIISSYISVYEKLKSSGGLLLSSIVDAPNSNPMNPHLRSRLLAGKLIKLGRPKEEELATIFSSLLQRKSLNLSERSLKYLISRVPANTLSFESISDKLDEFFREQGKNAKFSVVREIVNEE